MSAVAVAMVAMTVVDVAMVVAAVVAVVMIVMVVVPAAHGCEADLLRMPAGAKLQSAAQKRNPHQECRIKQLPNEVRQADHTQV